MILDYQQAASHYQVTVRNLQSIQEFNPTKHDPDTIYVAPIGDGMSLPFYVGMGSSDSSSSVLRLGFHGAKLGIPWNSLMFAPVQHFKNSGDPFILFDDPTLYLDEEYSLTWYLGTPEVDPHDAITAVSVKLGKALGIDEFLTMGSSGGGFAAIQAALKLPKSTAVAVAPQTDVFRYKLYTHPHKLIQKSWGNMSKFQIIDKFAPRFRIADALRASNSENQFVVRYVQNVGDTHHVDEHLKPLLSELGLSSASSGAKEIGLFVTRLFVDEGHVNTPIEVWESEFKLGQKFLHSKVSKGVFQNLPPHDPQIREVNIALQLDTNGQRSRS